MSLATRSTVWNVAEPGQDLPSDTDAASSPYGRPDALAAAAQYSLCVVATTTAHRRARRQAADIAARRVDRQTRLDFERDLMQVFGLAAPLVAMRVQPEAPAIGVAQAVVARDEGRHQNEAEAIGCRCEAPVAQHVVVGLPAAVQRHHHRRRAAQAVGQVDLVLALARAGVALGGERER